MARRAILGVTVGIILEHLLDDFGLEFAVRAFGNLGQIEILNRVAVDIELEGAAQRGEGCFGDCGAQRILREHALFVGSILGQG